MNEMNERVSKLIELVLGGKSFPDAGKELGYNRISARSAFFVWIRRLNPAVYDAGLSDEQRAIFAEHAKVYGDVGNYKSTTAAPSIDYLRANREFFTKEASEIAALKKVIDDKAALNLGTESLTIEQRKEHNLIKLVLNGKSFKVVSETLGYESEAQARAAFYRLIKKINPEEYSACLSADQKINKAAVPGIFSLRFSKESFISRLDSSGLRNESPIKIAICHQLKDHDWQILQQDAIARKTYETNADQNEVLVFLEDCGANSPHVILSGQYMSEGVNALSVTCIIIPKNSNASEIEFLVDQFVKNVDIAMVDTYAFDMLNDDDRGQAFS